MGLDLGISIVPVPNGLAVDKLWLCPKLAKALPLLSQLRSFEAFKF